MNRKREWGQNLPQKLTVEGSEFEKKRKPDEDDEGGAAGEGRQGEGEEAGGDRQMVPPPPQKKRKKKEDKVDSSLAENVTVKKKVMTVKDMLKSIQSMQQSKSVREETSHNNLGWGGPGNINISTNLHSEGKRNNIVGISENKSKQLIQKRISFEKIANMSETIIQQKGKLKGKVQQQVDVNKLEYKSSPTLPTSSFVLTDNRVATGNSKQNPEEVDSQGSFSRKKTRLLDESLVNGS